MKIKINNKTIDVIEKNRFFDKFKGIKCVLEPIKEAYQFRSHYANTYFLFQLVDVVMTDENDKILYMYPNCKTEKFIFPKRKVKYTYFLPLGACDYLEINQKLDIQNKKKV